MKILPFLLLGSALALEGCSKKEEPAATKAASAPVPITAPVSPQPTTNPAAGSAGPSDLPQTVATVPVTAVPQPPATPAEPAGAASLPALAPAAKPVVADIETPPRAASATASSTATVATPASTEGLGSDQIASGLKEALGQGLQRAISEVGKEGGFLNNLNVRIPMPDKIQQVEKAARAIGQGKLADQFIATMNQAAEQSVPAAATVFSEALTTMTIQDAQGILKGPNDAATEFFRRKTDAQLREKFLPTVKEATARTGVTAAYKQLMAKASLASPLLGKESMDLDGYVTTKAMDGLFKMVAEEEKRIRENPVARTTEVLKSVFGALKK